MGAPFPELTEAVPPVLMLEGFICALAVLGAYCPAPVLGPLLLSMCVRMSLVYLRRLVIS